MKKAVWFSVFLRVVPADYEAWLESLAAEGWNLGRVGQFSSVRMIFHKTEPKKYRYVFDLNAFSNKDYISTYEQFGWVLVGKMASCFLWRKEYTDLRPESFSDTDSIKKRNIRVKNAVSVSLVLCMIATLLILIGLGVCIAAKQWDKVLGLALESAFFGLFAFYLFWVVRQIKNNLTR